MQGTDPAERDSGRGVWRRNLSPGEESILQGAQHDVFVQFQVLFQEVCSWVVRSGQKRETGIICCVLCAAEPRVRAVEPAPVSTRKRKRPSHLRILCSDCYDFRYPKAVEEQGPDYRIVDEQNPDYRIRTLVWDHFLGSLIESESYNQKYAKLKATPVFFMDPPWPDGVDWTCAFDVLRGCAQFRKPFENLHELNQDRDFFLGLVHGCKFGIPHDLVSGSKMSRIQVTISQARPESPDTHMQQSSDSEDDWEVSSPVSLSDAAKNPLLEGIWWGQ